MREKNSRAKSEFHKKKVIQCGSETTHKGTWMRKRQEMSEAGSQHHFIKSPATPSQNHWFHTELSA